MTTVTIVLGAWMAIGLVSALVLGRMIRTADDHQPEFVCPDYYVAADWASERAA